MRLSLRFSRLMSTTTRQLAAWFSLDRFWNWLCTPSKRSASRRVRLNLELLEAREVPSVTAFDDSFGIHQGGTLDVLASGLLANDTTYNGPLLSSLVTGPAHASTATVFSSGRLFYRLAKGEVGGDGTLIPSFVGSDSLT